MNKRALLALALLVAAAGLEQFGHSAMTTSIPLDIENAGGTIASAANFFGVLGAVSFVATLGGGALALKVGPRVTAAIGLLVTALGFFTMAALGAGMLGAGVVGLGKGLFAPCAAAAAGEAVHSGEETPPWHAFAAVTAFVALLQGVTGVSARLAPSLGGLLWSRSGGAALCAASGGLALLAALLAAGAAILGMWPGQTPARPAPANPYRAPQPSPRPAAPARRQYLGLALLSVLVSLAKLAVPLAIYEPDGEMSAPWLLVLQGAVHNGAYFGIFGIWLAAALGRKSWLPLRGLAAGLVAIGIGLLPIVAAQIGGGNEVHYALGLFPVAFGAAAVRPVGLAYAALARPARVAPLVVAVWLCLPSLWFILNGLLVHLGRLEFVILTAVLCLVIGAYLARFAYGVQTLFDREAAPPAP